MDEQKPSKFDTALAKEKLVMEAMALIASGEKITIVARKLRTPVKQLTDWIYKFRKYGRSVFTRRPYQKRPPLKTPEAISEALRREKVVLAALRLMAEGLSQHSASYEVGVPMATLCRWRHAYLESGFVGLIPRGIGFGASEK